jgi:hypothetical protein
MNGGEVVNRSLAFLFSAGAVVFAITIAGCGNNDEPVPLGHAPAAETQSEKTAVAPGGAGKANSAFSATDKDKTIGNQESGEFF